MATFAKALLSGGTANGRGILVAATSSAGPGTLIHTGSTTTSHVHEIWLYAQNSSTSAVKLTVEWGGTGTGDQIELTIQPESGLVLVAPGLLLKGEASALVVRAFAGTTNVLTIFGYVHTII